MDGATARMFRHGIPLLRLAVFLPGILLAGTGACAHFSRAQDTATIAAPPYIDSIGYRAAKERLETVDRAQGNALVSQALFVPRSTAEQENQPDFFRSLEESYQRYLGLFRPVKKTALPEVRCNCDLAQTLRLQVFDPQPFFNALLHTMNLTDLSTLDFAIEPGKNDTILVRLQWARAASPEHTNAFSISEGTLILACTGRTARLLSGRP